MREGGREGGRDEGGRGGREGREGREAREGGRGGEEGREGGREGGRESDVNWTELTRTLSPRSWCTNKLCPFQYNIQGYTFNHGASIQPQGKYPGQRDTTNDHGMLGAMYRTPCHLPEEIL